MVLNVMCYFFETRCITGTVYQNLAVVIIEIEWFWNSS